MPSAPSPCPVRSVAPSSAPGVGTGIPWCRSSARTWFGSEPLGRCSAAAASEAGKAGQGADGTAGPGLAWQAWLGMARQAGGAWLGMDRHGTARQAGLGKAGVAGYVGTRQGMARHGRRGWLWQGPAWRGGAGMVWLGGHGAVRSGRRGLAGRWRGRAGFGRARRDMARLGRPGEAGHVPARLGEVSPGMSWQAWFGLAGSAW